MTVAAPSAHEIIMVGRHLEPIIPQLEPEIRVHRYWEATEPPAWLREHGPRVRALATDAFTRADAALMAACPRLELVAHFGVGYDSVDVGYLRSRGIALTNTPDVLTDDVADLAIALMLAVFRRIPQADRFVRDGRWAGGAFPLARKLTGSRLGICGLGRIGAAVARRAAGFELEIGYHGRRRQPERPWRYFASLEALAGWSDVLVLTVPETTETLGLVDARILAALGPQGVLVNVARGRIVNEPALVEALAGGRLGGAGLDVFAREPEVPAALLGLDNVVLLPHLGSATTDTRQAMADLVLRNLQAFFRGEPLLTPVTL
jgi:lactate dehydrogenase-like 2-hydroxyacid dehydrogenase